MPKKFTLRNFIDTTIIFLLIFVSSLIVGNNIFYIPNKLPSTVLPSLDFWYFVLVFGLVLFEEFVFRYFLAIKGWLGAYWLYFLSLVSIMVIMVKFSINYNFVSLLAFTFIPYIYLLYLGYKNKESSLYKQIFDVSSIKIALSALGFTLLHLGNYISDSDKLL